MYGSASCRRKGAALASRSTMLLRRMMRVSAVMSVEVKNLSVRKRQVSARRRQNDETSTPPLP